MTSQASAIRSGGKRRCFSYREIWDLLKDKDLQFDVEALEARLYFKGFYGDENITLKAQLDITQFHKIYLPIQARQLLRPYSDALSCAATLRCQKIEQILASKLTTLLHRRKAIDLFDLLYSIIFTKESPAERLQVISTFLKKSIFEPQLKCPCLLHQSQC